MWLVSGFPAAATVFPHCLVKLFIISRPKRIRFIWLSAYRPEWVKPSTKAWSSRGSSPAMVIQYFDLKIFKRE